MLYYLCLICPQMWIIKFKQMFHLFKSGNMTWFSMYSIAYHWTIGYSLVLLLTVRNNICSLILHILASVQNSLWSWQIKYWREMAISFVKVWMISLNWFEIIDSNRRITRASSRSRSALVGSVRHHWTLHCLPTHFYTQKQIQYYTCNV